MSSIKRNYTYNLLYHILTTILPLITAPYISRVIGPDGVGLNSYVYAMVSYFMLFAILGLNNYGNREISRNRDDLITRSTKFWQIYFMQLGLSTIVFALYLVFCVYFLKDEYKLVGYLSSFYIVGAMIDINWFFFGMEQFKTTVTRNTIIKLVTFVLTFVLVKNERDLWKYVLLLSFSYFSSEVVLWFFLKKHVVFIKPKWADILSHIKPNLILFLPVLAISIYEIMDKIMIGAISGHIQTGYYDYAYRIIRMPGFIFSALGTVMLPRISNLVAKKEYDSANQFIRDSLQFSVILSSAMAFGMASIAERLIPIYYGPGYEPCIKLMQCLAPVLLFSSWKSILRTQCLIPRGKDKSYIISVVMGAIINLIINSLLIGRLGAIGAAIGTLASEFIVCIYQTIATKDELPIKKYVLENWYWIVSGLCMFLTLKMTNKLFNDNITGMLLMIICGAITYVCYSSLLMLAFDCSRGRVLIGKLFRRKQ